MPSGFFKHAAEWLTLFGLCLLAGFNTVAIAQDQPNPSPRANIIVVMADDMGFSDLGCYGGEIKTPTIDRLAAEGIRFSHFYNCAICGPSRASLMTGCYPWKVGQAPGKSIFANLTRNCATIPELLKAAGYTTCAVGRLDMVTGGNWHEVAQVAKGVDRFLGSASGGAGNYYREAKGTPWFRDGQVFERPTGTYSTDLISDFVVDFIRSTKNSDMPFFIYVSHYAPHWPLQADEEVIAPYREFYTKHERKALMHDRLRRLIDAGLIPEETTLPPEMLNAREVAGGTLAVERMAIHAAMVESIDRSLAATLAALEEAGKQDNTLILVFSDNGASHQSSRDRKVAAGVRPGGMNTFLCQGPAVAALNGTPFRKFKVSNYEGGIASPLVAWWPQGVKNKGRLSHRPCHITDIMPTCLELAGIAYPDTFAGRKLVPLAGESLVPVAHDLSETRSAPRILVWPNAIREGRWKLVLENKNQPALYDLSQDRNEQKNLSATFPERVKQLRQLHNKSYPGK